MVEIHNVNSYRIGSKIQLTKEHKSLLVSCFKKRMAKTSNILGGRAEISTIDLSGIGSVVVKRYTRGGLLRTFNNSTYLKFLRYRCQAEYNLLLFLKQLGISVPDPIAFACQGKIFYKAWLITREIQNAQTLAEISRDDPIKLRMLMPKLTNQMDTLVENEIHHVDLHPGNVLVNKRNELFIIDFDKAQTNFKDRKKLHQKYIDRWQRAVLKHNLPAMLNLVGN